MINDAALIIKLFGGVKSLANAINKDPATIYRWTYPKNKGGTGGLIPSAALRKITEAAQHLNISLYEHEFITLDQRHSSSPAHPHQFINWFRSTAPYIQAHRGKTFVICFNGEAVDDPQFSDLIDDLALLNSLGIRLILVHGIRSQLERKIASSEQVSHVFQHLR